MDLAAVFILFFAALLFSVYQGIAILYPLLLGLICFLLLARRRGYPMANLLTMMLDGSKKSLLVIKIFVLIGAITAVWRACGTISFIVYYGIAFISTQYFLPSSVLAKL